MEIYNLVVKISKEKTGINSGESDTARKNCTHFFFKNIEENPKNRIR